MIRTLREGLLADGIVVPLSKRCAWFGAPRRTVCYTPAKSAPKVDPRFAGPIKAMIERESSFGYRTVAWLLGFNKNTVQRIIFQIRGWQVRKRPIGMRPRIAAVPSVAVRRCRAQRALVGGPLPGLGGPRRLDDAGPRDRRPHTIDGHTRELPGWQPSRSGKATTAASALEHALISRFGTLGKVAQESLLRSEMAWSSQVRNTPRCSAATG